jgi:hypothetical protein
LVKTEKAGWVLEVMREMLLITDKSYNIQAVCTKNDKKHSYHQCMSMGMDKKGHYSVNLHL